MGSGGGETRSRPFRVETVRGEPYDIDGRKLIPEARIVSFGKARGTIGTSRISGWAGGFTQVTPLAIVERTPEGEHRIAITDGTAVALRGMLGVAVAMTLFFAIIRWWVRQLKAQS